MKINHVALGERFEYQGKAYVKTGPMTAASDDGGTCIIPRHAVLSPPGTAQARRGAEQVARAAIEAAFEAFYLESCRLAPESARTALEDARRKFFEDLG